MTDQLGFDIGAVTDRRYTCCGQPCAPLSADPPHLDHPHAEDCPNPSIGTWIDRYGRTIRRLHCIRVIDGVETCPTGGRCPPDPRMFDPHGGVCCLVLREATP